MGEYPDNSIRSRDGQRKPDTIPEKKVEKVVTGAVKARKKSEAKKFANIFVPEDTASVKNYILMDVLVPGIKNAIGDIVSILLFGGAGRIGKKNSGSKISYQDRYDGRRDDRRDYSRPKNIPGYEYDDIIIETRGEADLVLDQLEEIISVYGTASIVDLYDLVGITGRSYTDRDYGWSDIRNAKVVRVRDGYVLQLPKAVPIN